MRVGAFIRAKASQNENATSQENGQTTAVRPSRQRLADLARVTVPATRVGGVPQSPLQRSGHKNGISPSQARLPEQNNVESRDPPFRDMFDTDVETIDDSTTTASFVGDSNQQPPHEIYPPNDRNPPQSFRPSLEPDYTKNTTNGYQSLAERLVSELGSDPEEDYGQEIGGHYPQDNDDEPADEGPGNSDEDTQVLDLESNKATNGEPLSWQRIEAVLREGHPQHEQGPTAPSSQPHASPRHEFEEVNDPRDVAQQENGEFHNLLAPKALSRLPVNSRFGQRSRFTTPNSYTAQLDASNGENLINSRPVLRPASAPGVPISPESANDPNFSAGIDAEGYNQEISVRNDQYNQTGAFDTTDLSALDESDSNYNQATYASLRLSTLSPVSVKRDHHTAFTPDYPPNILQSKTYADLKAESFDYNPAPPPPIFPPQEPPLPLTEKLDRLKNLTEDQRQAFFSSLSIDQWEESGDWILERFSILLNKEKEARRQRREVASVFENEIERRYESVEQEGEVINKRLEEMRTGGMGVLKGHNNF